MTRFRIVVPWILVEEVWTNYGSPGSKDAGVVQIMVDQLKTLQSYWIDEELNLIFEELILQKRTPRHLARPSDTLVRALLDLAPGEPKFREFLARLKVEKEENVRKRIEAQNELEGTLNAVGLPTKVTSEQDFFLNVIRPRHAAVYCDESHRMSLLNRLFGDQLAKRYPHYSRRIRRAIRALDKMNAFRFCITSNCILAKLLYIYAPLYRIDDGSRDGKPILRRGKSDQRGNVGDERFVANALMCDALITRDEGMAKIMKCLQVSRFWKGRVIYLDAQTEISKQIPGLL